MDDNEPPVWAKFLGVLAILIFGYVTVLFLIALTKMVF